MYRCDATLMNVELDVGGWTVGTRDDLEVRLVLDEDGDLQEVELPGTRIDAMFGRQTKMLCIGPRNSDAMAKAIWNAAVEEFSGQEERYQIAAGVEFKHERPEYTGREYTKFEHLRLVT